MSRTLGRAAEKLLSGGRMMGRTKHVGAEKDTLLAGNSSDRVWSQDSAVSQYRPTLTLRSPLELPPKPSLGPVFQAVHCYEPLGPAKHAAWAARRLLADTKRHAQRCARRDTPCETLRPQDWTTLDPGHEHGDNAVQPHSAEGPLACCDKERAEGENYGQQASTHWRSNGWRRLPWP